MTSKDFQIKVTKYRHKVMKSCAEFKHTHLASSLTCVPLLVACYFHWMKKTDELVFSKGHGGVAYAMIQNDVRKLKLKVCSHPEKDVANGLNFTLGSLGQGICIAIGQAIARPKDNIFCIISDGETDEGSTWEAIRLAGQLKLKNLVVLVDANGWQNYKAHDTTNLAAQIGAFGWSTIDCEDSNIVDVNLDDLAVGQPKALIVHSIKGKGLPGVEDKLESHYKKLTLPEYAQIISKEARGADGKE